MVRLHAPAPAHVDVKQVSNFIIETFKLESEAGFRWIAPYACTERRDRRYELHPLFKLDTRIDGRRGVARLHDDGRRRGRAETVSVQGADGANAIDDNPDVPAIWTPS
jgi:hypothetical protein